MNDLITGVIVLKIIWTIKAIELMNDLNEEEISANVMPKCLMKRDRHIEKNVVTMYQIDASIAWIIRETGLIVA